LKTKFI